MFQAGTVRHRHAQPGIAVVVVVVVAVVVVVVVCRCENKDVCIAPRVPPLKPAETSRMRVGLLH